MKTSENLYCFDVFGEYVWKGTSGMEVVDDVKVFVHLAEVYLLKVNNRNTRTRSEICSKLTVKTPARRQKRRSGVFIVNSEHISHLVLVFPLLTLNM